MGVRMVGLVTGDGNVYISMPGHCVDARQERAVFYPQSHGSYIPPPSPTSPSSIIPPLALTHCIAEYTPRHAANVFRYPATECREQSPLVAGRSVRATGRGSA